MAEILTYLPLVAALAAAGLFAGLIAGLFGIGGGVGIVPALFYTFSALGYPERAMHMAVATSLASIVATSIRSVAAHDRHGAVDWTVVRGWTPWIVLGALAGMAASAFIPGRGLTAIFGIVALVLAAQFYFGRPDWRLSNSLPEGPARWTLGALIGALSALMGIGGGTFGVSLMTMCGRPIGQAVGTAAGFGVAIGAPAALAAMVVGWGREGLAPGSIGHVNVVAFVLIATLTTAMAPQGARLAHAMDPALLRRLFGVALAAAAANLLYEAIAG